MAGTSAKGRKAGYLCGTPESEEGTLDHLEGLGAQRYKYLVSSA